MTHDQLVDAVLALRKQALESKHAEAADILLYLGVCMQSPPALRQLWVACETVYEDIVDTDEIASIVANMEQ